MLMRCDRCKKETKMDGYTPKVTTKSLFAKHDYDLCSDCYDAVITFIEEADEDAEN